MIVSMYDFFITPFQEFVFMKRALAGCLALSLGAATVGVFLTLRRMSLTGDVMAHAILPGVALGYLVAGFSAIAMTIGGMLAGFAVALLSGLVARTTIAREDASLAAFYLISLAAGAAIISTKGGYVDLLHILFGGALAMNDEALLLIGGIASATLFVLAVLYRPLVMECLDSGHFRSVSRLSPVAHYGFLILVTVNLVGGFHALGTLMAVGLMILPAAAARFWSRDLQGMLAVALAGAMSSGYAGLLLSYHAGWPAGPAIILTAGVLYILSLALGPEGAVRSRIRPRRHFQT